MDESSLSLLLYKYYGADADDALNAENEVRRRGWSRFLIGLIRALLLPLIFIERFVADAGGDIWDHGPPTKSDVAFSIFFSIFLIAAIPGLILGLTSLISLKPPHWSTVLLLASSLVLTLLPKRRA
jgi:hypothetical protein